MAAQTALVTGANGFVGAHVVLALVARGNHVRAFVRDGADTRALDKVDCEIAIGDVRDLASVERAVRGLRRGLSRRRRLSLVGRR